MAQNPFDQASRYAAKLDPVGFLCWLLYGQSQPLQFLGWLDTRTLPFPGDPERTCDTVACLNRDDRSGPWAVVVEFCLVPDATMFGRLLVYLGQLWLERRPTAGDKGRYQVAAVVVNLTGQAQTSRDMQWAGTSLRTCLQVVERNLAREDAAAALDGVASGSLARCVLTWVPLMRGADEHAILERWKELAEAEPDSQRRADYGGLAVVFAEAAGRRTVWKEALKEWNMIQSQQVLEWQAEASIRTKIQYVLRLLEKKFPPAVPEDLAGVIQASKDADELARWFDAAIDAKTLDEFRQVVQPADKNGA